jgi:hypothetical protein
MFQIRKQNSSDWTQITPDSLKSRIRSLNGPAAENFLQSVKMTGGIWNIVNVYVRYVS